MSKKFRVFATCDIGEAIDLLRKRGYEVEVYPAARGAAQASDHRQGEVRHRRA